MRPISTANDELLKARGGIMRRYRVSVKDSGGTFRDLTAYLGQDFVLACSWGETVDDNGFDASFTVKRQSEKVNVSPYMTTSPANVVPAFTFPIVFSPLIDVGREVLIEWALAPAGTATSALTWVKAMRGRIDSHNPTGSEVTFTARGRFGDALDAFIEEERIYAHANPADPDALRGLRMYAAGETYAVGELAVPGESKRNDHFYEVTGITTGIGGTEGTWPIGSGSTVTFGGVTFTERGTTTTSTGTALETLLQQLLNDNMSSPPTVNTPVSPGWLLRWWKQARTGAWTACRALVDQLGWDLRDVWYAGTSDLRFELRSVDRAKTVPDRTFGPGDRYELTRLEKRLDGIRNVVRVWFYDSQALDPQGNPTKKRVVRTNATSVAKYGRRFMEAAEDYDSETGLGSNIDTTAEAEAFADIMLSDLAEPSAEQECALPFFPFVELGDLYRFSPDGKHYDVDTDLAVVGYRHSFTSGDAPSARTTITCRGKPASGYERWLSKDGGRNTETHSAHTNNAAKLDLSALDTVGGTKLTVAANSFSKHALAKGYEFHVSDTPGFTPSPSSLVQSGLADEVTLGHLLPGVTYYGKVVPYGRNASKLVRGASSEQLVFTAGRASAGHMHGGIAIGDYPLNGGFETRLDAAGMPDHWTVYSGAYSTNVEVMQDGNGISGKRYVRLKAGGVRSAIYPMIQEAHEASRRGSLYRFHWWRKSGSDVQAGAQYSALIRLLDSNDNEVLILTVASTLPMDNKLGRWVHEQLYVRLKEGDASARSLQLILSGGSTTANRHIDVDEIRCQYLGSPWYEVGDTTYFTENYESVPAFQNSWLNFNTASYSSCAFRRDQFGYVEIKGLVKDGTANLIFTLPVGFRPAKNRQHTGTDGAEVAVRIEIGSNGTVSIIPPAGGTNKNYVSLDGIRFLTTDVANTLT